MIGLRKKLDKNRRRKYLLATMKENFNDEEEAHSPICSPTNLNPLHLLTLFQDILDCISFSVSFSLKKIDTQRKTAVKELSLICKDLVLLFMRHFKTICIITFFGHYITVNFVGFAKSTGCLLSPNWSFCEQTKLAKKTNWELFFTPSIQCNRSIHRVTNKFTFELKLEPETGVMNLLRLRNDEFVEIEKQQFSKRLDLLYSELNLSYTTCSLLDVNFTGFIDPKLMLQKSDLVDLVQFYDTEDRYVWLQTPKMMTGDPVMSVSMQTQKNFFNMPQMPAKAQASYALFIDDNARKISGGEKVNGSDLSVSNGSDRERNFEYVHVVRNRNKIVFRVNQLYWDLWNSNNMSLLNVSKESLGEDGSRIQLGKN